MLVHDINTAFMSAKFSTGNHSFVSKRTLSEHDAMIGGSIFFVGFWPRGNCGLVFFSESRREDLFVCTKVCIRKN